VLYSKHLGDLRLHIIAFLPSLIISKDHFSCDYAGSRISAKMGYRVKSFGSCWPGGIAI